MQVAESRVVDYTMLSEHYWPSIPRDLVRYHPRIQSLLASYLDTYAVLKKPRKLHPASSLGQVQFSAKACFCSF